MCPKSRNRGKKYNSGKAVNVPTNSNVVIREITSDIIMLMAYGGLVLTTDKESLEEVNKVFIDTGLDKTHTINTVNRKYKGIDVIEVTLYPIDESLYKKYGKALPDHVLDGLMIDSKERKEGKGFAVLPGARLLSKITIADLEWSLLNQGNIITNVKGMNDAIAINIDFFTVNCISLKASSGTKESDELAFTIVKR